MNSKHSLLSRFLLAATLMWLPAANAQTIHFAGSGASANWQSTALAAFSLALNIGTGTYGSGTGSCAYHFTAKGNNADLNAAAVLVDGRSSSIPQEPGNVWVVWVGDCNASNPGTTNVTDIWLDVSVDPTIGVRALYAATKVGTASVQGIQVSVDTSNPTSTNAINQKLWANDTPDTLPLPAAVSSAINANGGVHVNVALADSRPEDALFGTLRALGKYDATNLSGLGYDHGPSKDIGNSIYSYLTASSLVTPVLFALSGTDPITKATIAQFVSLPVGAAPVIYIMNNGGTTPIATDIEDGFNGAFGGESYPLAKLLDGTTPCTTSNAAFGNSGVGSTPLTIILREPTAGAMQVNEYSTIRIEGTGFPGSPASNVNDSQEKGITTTTTTPYNPLHLACPGGGYRERAIGTSDLVGGIKSIANSLGYTFYSFGNVSSIAGSKQYNYLTLDGVDPLGIPGIAQQELPACSVPNCTQAAVWQGGPSYPHLRDGTYRDWSIYRWIGQPGSPHFCANNLPSNPVTACHSTTATPTEASYSASTGVATLKFSAAPAATVGEKLVVSGYVNHTSGKKTYTDSDYNGTYTVKSRTTTEITYQLATGLVLNSDTTDPGSAIVSPLVDAYGVQALAQAAQDGVDDAVADFVPFSTSDGSDGLNVYHSHSNITIGSSTVTGNNGNLVQTGSDYTHGGGPEAGTDLGGCIEVGDSSEAGELNCKQ
jgi:hypothetical protein